MTADDRTRTAHVDTIREGLDRVFSRDVLGAVFVGMSAKQVVDSAVTLVTLDPVANFLLWVAVLAASIALFVYWDHLEARAEAAADEAAEQAVDAVDTAAETADDVADAVADDDA